MLWHPLAVHFPIALLTAGVLLDLAALLCRRPAWHRTAYGLLVAGTLGAGLAVVTGNVDAAAWRETAAAGAIQDHEDLGTLTMLLYLAVCLGRLPGVLRPGDNRYRPLWVALATLGWVLLAWTGWEGGELVYDLGVGVSGRVP